MRKRETEALVVGAGPVGMLAALALAERGVGVEIVDEEWRSAARSYALGLHGQTLELLDELDRSSDHSDGEGLVARLIERGHKLERVAFYDREEARAAVDLGSLRGDYPFLLVLPQKDLEDLLEERLERHGVRVEWNHRLAELEVGEGGPSRAVVERLGKESTGYSVATTVWVVEKRREVTARWVIGADGHRSRVRRALGVEFPALGEPELFAVFEVGARAGAADELRVVLEDSRANVLWPLGPGRRRWSFQLDAAELDESRPDKSRLAVQVGRESYPFLSRESLERWLAERAPWFDAPVGEIAWSVAVQFERRLAESLGRDGVWLAGDAAHLGPPIGVHSMNRGLAEAIALAERMAGGGGGEGRSEVGGPAFEDYERSVRSGWRGLLELAEGKGVEATAEADPWVAERAGRILSCLPASGEDLEQLAGQLGLKI